MGYWRWRGGWRKDAHSGTLAAVDCVASSKTWPVRHRWQTHCSNARNALLLLIFALEWICVGCVDSRASAGRGAVKRRAEETRPMALFHGGSAAGEVDQYGAS